MAKAGGSVLHTLFLVGVFLVGLGTLGVSIAILVNVLNGTNNNPAPPAPPQTTNDLNIPQPAVINSNDNRHDAYKQVVDLFKKSVNTQVNPCDDFYAYTCGNFDGDMGFDVSDDSNVADMTAKLLDDAYIKQAPKPVQQTRWYFDQCVNARQNWNKLVADGSQVINAINQLGAGNGFPSTKIPFPMWDQNKDVTAFPDKFGLGYLVGYLAGQGIPTLISPGVDTNWKDPAGPEGFAYYIDQPSTFRPNTYYQKDWTNTKNGLIASINATMNLLAQTQKRTLKQNVLNKDINDIVQLDYLLATVFSTDDTTRRQYDRSYNPNTMSTLRANFLDTIFSWHMFIPLSTGTAEHVLDKLLNGDSYQYYVVMEQDKLQLLLSSLVNGNKYNISPRQLVNYLYYRLVDANSEFLPWPTDSIIARPIVKLVSQGGKPRHELPEKRKYTRKHLDALSDAQYSCAAETIDQMQFANARIFIDKIYPTADSRKAVREHVAKVASSIVVGFRSMIDQLNWMTTSTKKGAYNKIENLVKNIAYPDWITDDVALTNYHTQMNFTKQTGYFDMVQNALDFNNFVMWDQLVQGAADRQGFNGPPGVTNAWYQPELNSITFPAGILKQPFYDFNWPASVNFGAMGVIAGHELTHGFDDQGVQWNGVGTLNGWMDDQSQKSFKSMAQCVVDEYSSFCPLNKTVYGAAACIDGAQTQGENIADNGGIHSAYRAYKNYVDLYGPDPVLPDSQFQHFTPDQLFFLGFAQVWCQLPPSDARMLRQILVDVHSPSIYRVWGTIQNFPAFKTAFNCPASNYAPDKHCNVWVSDIDTTFGLPQSKSDINVVPVGQLTARNVPQFTAYQKAVDYYSKSVDTTIDPCDDFYKYACGKFDQPVSFYSARAQNLIYMSNKLTDPAYQDTIKNSTALTKEKQFYNACVAATSSNQNEDQILIANNYIQKKVNNLQGFLGQGFSLVYGTKGQQTAPSSKQLGDALGYLSFEEGIDTLISPLVDTFWEDNTKGYQLFIDQNTAYLSKSYYQPSAWKIEKPKYLQSALSVVQHYAKEQNVNLNTDQVTKDLGDILDFEQMLATQYSTDDNTRRQFRRSWNLAAVGDLPNKYNFIDWTTYFSHVPQVVRAKVNSPAYKVAIMETGKIAQLSTDYKNLPTSKLVNLLYLRLLLGNAQYIPSYSVDFQSMPEESITLGLSRKRILENFKFTDNAAANGPDCAGAANNMMQFANGRVFIDYMYPTADDVTNIRYVAGGIIKNVITSFQGMIDQLDWMSSDTKKLAYDKTAQIKQNIAFPDWIADNQQLDAYYKDLVFANTDNYYAMFDKLNKYNILIQYRQLNAAQTDRSDFLGQPGTVNAWYQPELNSITFPAGILVPPYFHPQWPTSINYGGMGLVAGHELTHGFDDQGVQWGPTGNLAQGQTWMDKNSTDGFKDMAQCVINEYSKFCPLDNKSYSPNCVNGVQTQGENIADNGGIHAAFNAYRNHLSLDGPESLLPDRLYGQFSHDQLFFLNFAQVWCEKRRSDDDLYKQIMVDPHSPSMYRVFGTVQNFPAFQTAFNCKAGSNYAPQPHCNVWVPGKYQ